MKFTIMMFIIMSKNPYFLLIVLLMTTLYTVYMMSAILASNFFSYLILLIIMGGLLIMFLYLITLIPTEAVSINWKFLFFMVFMYFFLNKYFIFVNMDLSNLNTQNLYKYTLICSFFIMFLLWTLFSSTFLTNLKLGPLRKIYEKYHNYNK